VWLSLLLRQLFRRKAALLIGLPGHATPLVLLCQAAVESLQACTGLFVYAFLGAL
jgi:hypothetical protein